MTSALDYSSARPSAADLVDVGIARVLFYLGNSRPSQDYCDELTRAGIVWTFIFETDPNRSQQGWNAGVLDAQFSDPRVRDRGYSDAATLMVVVSDGNRFSPSSGGERIADYAEAWVRTSVHPLCFYGNRYAIDAAIGGALRAPGGRLVAGPNNDGGWIPVPWGSDPSRDLLGQEANFAPPLGGTDLNTVYHDYTTAGAPAPTPGPRKGRSVIYDETRDDGLHNYWQEGFGGLVQLPDSVAAAHVFQGDLVLQVSSLDIIALSLARGAQAKKFLAANVPAGGGGPAAHYTINLAGEASPV